MAINDNDLLLISDSEDNFESKKIKYSTLKSNIATDVGASDLQAVTDVGNTTTNGASFGGPINSGTVSGSTPFGQVFPGSIQARPAVFSDLTFAGYATSGADPVFSVNGSGNAFFGGEVIIDNSGNATPNIKMLPGGSAAFAAGKSSLNSDGSGVFTKKISVKGTVGIAGGAANFEQTRSHSALKVEPASDAANQINIGPYRTAGNIYVQGTNNAGTGGADIYYQPFGGSLMVGQIDLNQPNSGGVQMTNIGSISVMRPSINPNDPVFTGHLGGALPAATTSQILANGNATFQGTVTVNGNRPLLLGEGVDEIDVKDRILNLVSRLDALEANEVIDDAVDTSLLSLLASASARLDSIEARLAALEGGN